MNITPKILIIVIITMFLLNTIISVGAFFYFKDKVGPIGPRGNTGGRGIKIQPKVKKSFNKFRIPNINYYNATKKYKRNPRKCVNGHNIRLIKNQTVEQCAKACENDKKCKSFEYGTKYGGKGKYKAKDCQLQNSSNMRGCNGSYHNLDLYTKR